ncbi:MAG: hypothetical protein ACERKD_00190 [Prolixibacteraceae bacterium]
MRQPEMIRSGAIEILYLDYSGIKKKDEVLAQMEYFGNYIRQQPFQSVVTLTNLNEMYFNTEVYNRFTAYVKSNTPHVKESAVIGLKGMMQIFYKGFVKITGRNVTICNSKDEAVFALSKHLAEAV